MRRLLNNALLLITVFTAAAAQASSPDAWSAHDKEVAAACVKASRLKNAKPAGQPMAYDDSVGMTALLVAGRYPQAHMKNRPGRVLCLFDRKKREAAVTEADQLSLAPATPSKTKK
jgi:hypothetical protein